MNTRLGTDYDLAGESTEKKVSFSPKVTRKAKRKDNGLLQMVGEIKGSNKIILAQQYKHAPDLLLPGFEQRKQMEGSFNFCILGLQFNLEHRIIQVGKDH